jgi:hypothetical protein
LVIVVVLYAFIVALFEPHLLVDRWMSNLVGHSPVSWLRTAPQWVAAVLSPAIIFGGLLLYSIDFPTRPGPGEATAAGAVVVAYLGVIGVVIATGLAWLLVLLHTGLVSATSPIPDGSNVTAAAAAFAWHITDSLPGPNIPQTLNWTLTYDFTGRTATIFYLVTKVVVFGVLLFGVARAIRALLNPPRSRPAISGSTPLSAVARYSKALLEIQRRIDREEWVRMGAATGLPPQDERKDSFFWDTERGAVGTMLADLEAVSAVFGPGEVADRADSAAAALYRRYSEVPSKFELDQSTRRTFGSFPRRESIVERQQRHRAEAFEQIRAFKTSAADSLAATATDVADDGLDEVDEADDLEDGHHVNVN